MTLKLGVVMDPIGSIAFPKDSTLAMLLEAQTRSWEIYYMEQSDLFLRDGETQARTRRLKVAADPKHWFEFGAEATAPLTALEAILMPKAPPFDMQYIYTTMLLERAEVRGVLVVNKPQSLRDCNEKLFTAWFPNFTPPTLVTRSAARLRDFLAEHGDVILKPLDAMGGASVFRLRTGDPNINVAIETLTRDETEYAMAQRFIPEIAAGDKRILLVDGAPVPYALARIPAPGETRGNLAAGGGGVGGAPARPRGGRGNTPTPRTTPRPPPTPPLSPSPPLFRSPPLRARAHPGAGRNPRQSRRRRARCGRAAVRP